MSEPSPLLRHREGKEQSRGPIYPKYSIVIPAYNESARIPATLESVVACDSGNQWEAEVIVVNDGSTDSTARLVRDFALALPKSACLKIPEIAAKATACARGCFRRRATL